jgi:hypothetical protein
MYARLSSAATTRVRSVASEPVAKSGLDALRFEGNTIEEVRERLSETGSDNTAEELTARKPCLIPQWLPPRFHSPRRISPAKPHRTKPAD